MQSLWKYIRSFFVALQMTLRGEGAKPSYYQDYPELAGWANAGLQRVNQILDAAQKHEFDQRKRETFTLKIDSRDISMETILKAVQHNLKEEYPRLMRLNDEFTKTVIYATNLNDRYRVQQLANDQRLDNSSLKIHLMDLHNHLNNIPQQPNHRY